MITDSPAFVRSVNTSKVQCNWCFAPATWQIRYDWEIEYVCTVHGSEWFPVCFPESESASIEEIVAEIPTRFMVKCTRCGSFHQTSDDWNVTTYGCEVCTRTNPVGVGTQPVRPWYPLVGHRGGLRANDPVSLASAFVILALEGGTAHLVGHGPWPWEAKS